MDDPEPGKGFSREPTIDDVANLCQALNKAGARYTLIGGFAMAHHGFIRATGDIDLLVDDAPENIEKIRSALSYLPDRAVRDVRPNDIQEYTVVRVADEIVIDLLGKACGLNYSDARSDIEWTTIRDVQVPFLGLRSLLKTKQAHRPQDIMDRAFLEEKLKRK